MTKMKLAVVLIVLGLCAGACALIEKPVVKRLALPEPAMRAYPLEPKFLQANDLNIAYVEAGSGPWLVLIHGGVVPTSLARSMQYQPLVPGMAQSTLHAGAIATIDGWNYNLDALAKNFHVVALDLPGFGASEKPDAKYTREFFVSYLSAFLDAKGIDKASFIGHDLGGAIVLGYALDHPERVDRLVVVNSYGAHIGYTLLKVPRPMLNWWQREKAAKINVVYGLVARLMGDNDKLVKYAVRTSLNQKVKNNSPEDLENVILYREGKAAEFIEQVAAYRAKFLNSRDSAAEVRALHSALRESRRNDIMTRFGEIKAPVLIIYGQYCPFVEPDAIEFMNQKIPDSSVIVYSRSAHYPMVEEADRFNNDVISFLATPRAAAPSAAPAAVPK